jgi:hypothetical protein
MHPITKLAAGVLASVALLAGITTAADAATTSQSNIGVNVSPSRMEVHLNAAGRGVQKFTVSDYGTLPEKVTAFEQAYTEQANGEMTPGQGAIPGSVSGTAWVKVSPATFRLKPGQSRVVTVTIKKPADAQPGQRTVAVLFSATGRAPHGRSGAVMQGAVAGEMIIDTPGKLIRSATYSLHAPSFSFGGPVELTATIKNTGNAYVYDSSNATAGGQRVTMPRVLVLARTSRSFTLPVHLGVGIQHVSYMGQTVTVIVLPGKLLAEGLGGLALLGGLFFFYRAAKRSGRRSVRTHRSTRHA